MNKTLMAAGLAVILGACSSSKKSDVAEGATPNPFFAEYTTPFGVPPFDQIEVAHYKPALLKGMEEQSKEIEAIVANPDAPTFENTIVALDQSGELLTKVMYAFGGQSSVNTTDEIQELERELYPLLSKHSDDISLNPKLFARVKSVYENQASFHLDKEQKKLLEETYKSFVRGGANLPEDKQVFWFLLAFFCYIDGVYTIIDMATAYGTALGLDTTGLLLALLVTQIVAFPSALIFGRLSNKYPSAKLIPVCIAAYAGIAVFAFFLTQQWQFWVLAVIVGMFQGGVQALSRSHFAKIIPPEKSGEYFGLFDICGKGASFLGTMIVSVGSQLTGSANVGVGSLIVLFIVGFVLFRVSFRQGETV